MPWPKEATNPSMSPPDRRRGKTRAQVFCRRAMKITQRGQRPSVIRSPLVRPEHKRPLKNEGGKERTLLWYVRLINLALDRAIDRRKAKDDPELKRRIEPVRIKECRQRQGRH
jgi:hypothetical protein